MTDKKEDKGLTVKNLINENVSADEYGKNAIYQNHLLEQYKLYVEMADRVSARRNLANTFFLTLNSLIIGLAGFFLKESIEIKHKILILLFMIAMLTLCYTWWRLIKSYRQLNTGKFKVVGELEKFLPASPYWRAEWKVLGEGNDPKLYKPLTNVEVGVPIIFAAIYILGAISIFLK